MTDEQSNNSSKMFFSKKALSNLQSPEDLEKRLSVTAPSVWIIIIACVALLAGVLIWSIFGVSMKRTVLKGVWTDGYIIAFADSDSAILIDKGSPAYIDGKMYEVEYVDFTPIDSASLQKEFDIEQLYADFLLPSNSKASYPVMIKKDYEKDIDTRIMDVTVITDERSPIQLLFEK